LDAPPVAIVKGTFWLTYEIWTVESRFALVENLVDFPLRPPAQRPKFEDSNPCGIPVCFFKRCYSMAYPDMGRPAAAAAQAGVIHSFRFLSH
jgi:hypothetical protein